MMDEERLIEAVTKTINPPGVNDAWARAIAAKVRIELLRQIGITITPPPAPEPTYTIRLTADERDYLVLCCDRDNRNVPSVIELRNRLVNATADDSPPE